MQVRQVNQLKLRLCLEICICFIFSIPTQVLDQNWSLLLTGLIEAALYLYWIGHSKWLPRWNILRHDTWWMKLYFFQTLSIYLSTIYAGIIVVSSFTEIVFIMQIGNRKKTPLSVVQEDAEDIKQVISMRQSKKDRQYNG